MFHYCSLDKKYINHYDNRVNGISYGLNVESGVLYAITQREDGFNFLNKFNAETGMLQNKNKKARIVCY